MVEALAHASAASDFAELALRRKPASARPRARRLAAVACLFAASTARSSARGNWIAVTCATVRSLVAALDPTRAGGAHPDRALDVAFALGDVDRRRARRHRALRRRGAICFGDEASARASRSPGCARWSSRPTSPARASACISAPAAAIASPTNRGRAPARSRSRAAATTLFAKAARVPGARLARPARRAARAGSSARQPCPPQPGRAASSVRRGDAARPRGGSAARVAQRAAAERALTVEQWSIAFRFARRREPWTARSRASTASTPPKGRLLGRSVPDPARTARNYIFFEELPAAAAPSAHISVVEVDRDGRASQRRCSVLERDYHLSYPFLVEEDGAALHDPGDRREPHGRDLPLRRVPAQVEARARADRRRLRAPTRRCIARTTAGGCSPTPRPTARRSTTSCTSSRADTLLGDWKPHRRNPVKTDVRSARPAGRLFRAGRQSLYRPGADLRAALRRRHRAAPRDAPRRGRVSRSRRSAASCPARRRARPRHATPSIAPAI